MIAHLNKFHSLNTKKNLVSIFPLEFLGQSDFLKGIVLSRSNRTRSNPAWTTAPMSRKWNYQFLILDLFFTQAQPFQHSIILEKDLSDNNAMLLEPHNYSFFFSFNYRVASWRHTRRYIEYQPGLSGIDKICILFLSKKNICNSEWLKKEVLFRNKSQ